MPPDDDVVPLQTCEEEERYQQQEERQLSRTAAVGVVEADASAQPSTVKTLLAKSLQNLTPKELATLVRLVQTTVRIAPSARASSGDE